MVNTLADLARQPFVGNTYVGDAGSERLQSQLTSLPQNAPAMERLLLNFQLGEAQLVLGKEREAIENLVRARASLPQAADSNLTAMLNFRLGVAYMRLGETQNCCLRNTPESCIIPIRGGGIHTNPEGSLQAIHYFTEVLQQMPKDSSLYLAARWLLNIAYMTLGTYPDEVPTGYRIPTAAFESTGQFPRFRNILASLGLDTFSLSGGAISDDFDNDGYLDFMVSTWELSGQLRFFVNNGDGTFTDHTTAAGLEGIYGGLNMVQGDYDNDGNVDVFVLRGAWLGRWGQHPNSLLHNNGDRTFTDVTFMTGLAEVHYPTQTAGWADYDLDGDLDLYIGNESASAQINYPCQLFRNNGDATFTDVADEAGVKNGLYSKAIIWGDYNGDRFPDIYVSNFSGKNRLFHNNGNGTFTDVATALGVDGPRESFPAWFWDVDNDGVLDLFVSAYTASIHDIAAGYLDLSVRTEMVPRLFRGSANKGFTEVSRQMNLTRPTVPMGSNFGDIDNDGYLDFYLGTGRPEYMELMPNVMYHNRGGDRFDDVTMAGGFGNLQKGHAVVFADLDNDGDQDVFEQMGGAYRGDRYNDALYENPGFGNQWISIMLEGVRSNRSAIGTRIWVDIDEGGAQRTIYKYVNSGGTFGGNPLRQTIGLGRAQSIERLEIFWPSTGERQIFEEVDLNQFIRIVEDEDRYTIIPLRRLKLGVPEASSTSG